MLWSSVSWRCGASERRCGGIPRRSSLVVENGNGVHIPRWPSVSDGGERREDRRCAQQQAGDAEPANADAVASCGGHRWSWKMATAFSSRGGHQSAMAENAEKTAAVVVGKLAMRSQRTPMGWHPVVVIVGRGKWQRSSDPAMAIRPRWRRTPRRPPRWSWES